MVSYAGPSRRRRRQAQPEYKAAACRVWTGLSTTQSGQISVHRHETHAWDAVPQTSNHQGTPTRTQTLSDSPNCAANVCRNGEKSVPNKSLQTRKGRVPTHCAGSFDACPCAQRTWSMSFDGACWCARLAMAPNLTCCHALELQT